MPTAAQQRKIPSCNCLIIPSEKEKTLFTNTRIIQSKADINIEQIYTLLLNKHFFISFIFKLDIFKNESIL